MTYELGVPDEASRVRLTWTDLDDPTAVFEAAVRWVSGNGWVQLVAFACVAALMSALKWEHGQRRAVIAEEAAGGTEWFWDDVSQTDPAWCPSSDATGAPRPTARDGDFHQEADRVARASHQYSDTSERRRHGTVKQSSLGRRLG